MNAEYGITSNYDFDEDGFTPSESGWAGVAASFSFEAPYPILYFGSWHYPGDDIIHAGLFCLFLLTIAKHMVKNEHFDICFENYGSMLIACIAFVVSRHLTGASG